MEGISKEEPEKKLEMKVNKMTEERGKRRKKRGRGGHGSRRRLVVFGCLGVVVLAAVFLLFTPIFNIAEVYCEGNDKIAAEDVVKAANVELGKNIFSVRMGKIRRNVESIAFVEEASVYRVFPNKIRVSVRECMPVSYVYTNEKCYMIDEAGKILRIVEDKESVDALIVSEEREKYENLAKKKEGQEAQDKLQKTGQDEEEDAEAEPTRTPEPTATAEAEENEDGEEADKKEKEDGEEESRTEPTAEPTQAPSEGEILRGKYNIPVVLGLEYEKAEAGEMPKSRNEERYRETLELLKEMKNTDLLFRSTLVDVRNPSDIRIWIEDRLEIMLSGFDNLSYKPRFLAKVINEGISAYEHAVVDYRGEDVYVRPHDDGEDRVKTKKKSGKTDDESKETAEKKNEKTAKEADEDDDGGDVKATAKPTAKKTKETVDALEDDDEMGQKTEETGARTGEEE